MKVLDVYLTRHCIGCEEALRLAEEINRSIPSLQARVNMLDEMTDGDLPDIPATPAYFFDGQLLFLGNPYLEELLSRIAPLNNDRGENSE